jgi:aryl-alcohol dehydrogenase-like predicted oxidoreductase
MRYRQLGYSDLNISRIGFGAMSLKDGEAAAKKVIRQAIDGGINYFDTADLYDQGRNEEILGKALKEKRSEVIIATKVGNRWRNDGNGWDWDPRKEYILSAVEDSLRRLGTDYIDLYQLHGGTINDPIDETIETFELLVRQGKIRYYGISSIRPNVIRAWAERSRMVSVMMQYSLLDRRPEESCFSLLQEKGIGILARGTVAQGLLADKPPKPYLGHSEAAVSRATEAVQSLSGPHRSAAQTSLCFVLNQPAITSAVLGIRTHQQLQEAIHALKTPPLSPTELRLLRDSAPALHYTDHR